jgi:ribosomal protection tetracycline resistance protein
VPDLATDRPAVPHLNLGVVAHVDAGKTTLTERLLYTAGVIHRLGKVDDGTTQTDTLELERRRGITIKSAVVAFTLGDTRFNLIDTPGHPDFIAEVERVVGLLDAAVLVVSAVEGVQSQTRILLRTLKRLRIPTTIFINKIDRMGADPDRVTDEIRHHLTPDVVAMGAAASLGTREATFVPYRMADTTLRSSLIDLVSMHDTDLLAALVADEAAVTADRLQAAFVKQTRAAHVHPVYAGSAATGAGVDALVDGLRRFSVPPCDSRDPSDAIGRTSAVVFKVDRGMRRERIAYVRVFSGSLRTRSAVDLHGTDETITSLDVFDNGTVERRDTASASEIAKVVGLKSVRVGDVIGVAPRHLQDAAHFAPPSIEASVVATRGTDRVALLDALTELAEQDPLINLRHDPERGDIYLSLYGEVQKQVIAETLALDYGLEVSFRESSVVHIERLAGTGSAFEPLKSGRSLTSPFIAGLGLRVEPGPEGSGTTIDLGRARGALPRAFVTALRQAIEASLAEGLCGWTVADCAITVTHAAYAARQSSANATFNRNVSTIANDFRLLVPLVLTTALAEAGTTVHEPVHHFTLRLPPDTVGSVLPALAQLGAIPEPPSTEGTSCIITGVLAAGNVQALHRELPELTRGEGDLHTAHHGYRPVHQRRPPTRRRTTVNALDRQAYLLYALRRLLA